MDKENFLELLEHGDARYGRELFNHRGKQVKAILNGKNPPPYEVEIQPSARCNANCIFCFGAGKEKLEERLTTKSAMDRVISQVLEFKQDDFEVEMIKFCGSTGEPLVNPLTLYALEQLGGKKYLRLFTNGIKIGKHRDDNAYLAPLKLADRINWSGDSAKTETMHKIKPGSKNIEIENILCGLRNIRTSSKIPTWIEAGFVITEDNYREIPEFARKTGDFKAADSVRYRIDMTNRDVSKNHGKEIVKLLKEAKSYESRDFKVISIHDQEEINAEDQEAFSTKACGLNCYLPYFWACIAPNGDFYPCGHTAFADTESYGNILEQDFKEIWNNNKRKSFPGEKCDICPPFSMSTNNLMTYLSQISLKEVEKLHKKYVTGPKKAMEVKAA